MSVLIKNSWVVTQDSERSIAREDVYIEGDRIADVGKNLGVRAEHRIDGTGKILAPGLVNTHTHIAMSPLRGLVDDVSLDRFLETTFRFDATNRTREDVYGSALLGMLESIRFGTTAILDLYYDEDVISQAAADSGIRAVLAWVALDREFTTQKGDPLTNAKRFAESKPGSKRVEHTIGMQGIYVCSDDTLMKGMDFARKANKVLPMHVAETRKEVSECKKKRGATPVEHMGKIGFLSSNLVSVHTVYVTPREIALLGGEGVSVSHNPVSNMKLGNGPAAPVAAFLDGGITTALGTDSVSSNNNLDMFQVMKVSALLQKNESGNPTRMSALKALDSATLAGARALGKEKDLGSVEVGKLADLILIDPVPNGLPLSQGNIVSNIVYSIEGLNVDTTIIGGEILMQNKALKMDAAKVAGSLKAGKTQHI